MTAQLPKVIVFLLAVLLLYECILQGEFVYSILDDCSFEYEVEFSLGVQLTQRFILKDVRLSVSQHILEPCQKYLLNQVMGKSSQFLYLLLN